MKGGIPVENIYEWLYDHYADPLLQKTPSLHRQLVEPILDETPPERRLWMEDRLDTLQMEWGTAAFAAGVRLGLALGGTFAASEDP